MPVLIEDPKIEERELRAHAIQFASAIRVLWKIRRKNTGDMGAVITTGDAIFCGLALASVVAAQFVVWHSDKWAYNFPVKVSSIVVADSQMSESLFMFVAQEFNQLAVGSFHSFGISRVGDYVAKNCEVISPQHPRPLQAA